MQRFCARIASHIAVMLLILSFCSCALLYSYRNIDRYIRWSLDDYIQWSDGQGQPLRERLRAQLTWNQATQLPLYRAWLEARRAEVSGDIDIAQWRSAAAQLQTFWQDAMLHAAADIEAQLVTLSDRQVHDLIATMREKQLDIAKQYHAETLADVFKRRSSGIQKTVKYWLGSLDEKQLALIDEWAQRLPDGRQPWLDSRARWTDAFEQALAHRHEPDVFTAAIQRLFVTPQENWDDEYREVSQRSLDAGLQLFVALHNTSSQRQRQAERDRIEQWLKVLDELAVR